jgi:hypothetical protein
MPAMNIFLNFALIFFSLVYSNGDVKKDYGVDPDFFPPVQVSPVYGAYLQKGEVQFTWTRTGKKNVYELMTARNPDFSDGVRYACSDTTFRINFTEDNAAIYWKVRAFKNKKTFSEWSSVFTFYVGIQPVEINNVGCNHDCAHCKHPCGRRAPDYDIIYKKE